MNTVGEAELDSRRLEQGLTLFTEGDRLYDAMLCDIRTADSAVRLECYILARASVRIPGWCAAAPQQWPSMPPSAAMCSQGTLPFRAREDLADLPVLRARQPEPVGVMRIWRLTMKMMSSGSSNHCAMGASPVPRPGKVSIDPRQRCIRRIGEKRHLQHFPDEIVAGLTMNAHDCVEPLMVTMRSSASERGTTAMWPLIRAQRLQ